MPTWRFADVTTTPPAAGPLAQALRAVRKHRRLSIAQLASMGGVSPRLICELERRMPAHVSFETAMPLLYLVDVTVTFEQRPVQVDEAARIRAEARRTRWSAEQSTLSQQAPPPPSSDARGTDSRRAGVAALGWAAAPCL